MRALWMCAVALLLSGCGTALPTEAASERVVSACDAVSAQTIRCKALLTFQPALRVYLDDIPVAQADNVAGAVAAYFVDDDRIEWSSKLPRYGETWAVLTMRHEFVHALSYKMPAYRSDARAGFVGLRAAIAAADGERQRFVKYDQWVRARPESLDDLPHFFTGIVELMRPGELPASLDQYFAPVLSGGSIDKGPLN